MSLKIVGATLLALVAASASATAAEQTIVSSTQFIPNSGDCNGNGVADRNEPLWANRDDDGDGICNGVDASPLDPGNELSDHQAITVPARADDPSAPHVTYSGAVITLKGIARGLRAGTNQFMWDFGDGSASAWTNITDRYNLGVTHTYTGSVGDMFTATLSIRNTNDLSRVATASYPIVIKDGGSSLASLTREQTDVRAQMAIDQALWYLHFTLTRGTYVEGAPGYRQPYAVSINLGDSCAVATAFATHGHVAARPWSVTIDALDQAGNGWRQIPYHYDPYVETVRLLLNYMTANAVAPAITSQWAGNPDVNGNGIGVAIGGTDYNVARNGVCAMAFAESAGPDWFAGTGPANVYGRAHRDIAQDLTEWLASAQTDAGHVSRGGWGDGANNQASNNEVTRWVVMALLAQEARMGAVTPRFVRTELPFWLNYARYSSKDYRNGSTGYSHSGNYNTVAFTAGAVFGTSFGGHSRSYPEVQAAVGFIVRAWMENDTQYHTNLGDSNTMFSVARAFRSFQPGITLISDFDYFTGWPIATGAFHWYYGPANEPQLGYAGNLIARQVLYGAFVDTTKFDENGFSLTGRTALGAMVLVSHGAPATLTASPSSLDFGSIDVGATSAAREVTLTNDGDYDFSIDMISATGPFLVNPVCVGSVPPAGGASPNTCAIYVTFAPAAGGAATGVVTITGTSGLPTTIPLSGFGFSPKETPAITWQPATITYGTALGALHLNATTDVAGTFTYSPAAGTLLSAGTGHLLSVTFTPTDADQYESVTTTVVVDVAPASPVMTLTAPAVAYNGQPHSANATATGVNGEDLGPITITYDGQSELPVSAGTYTVVASIAASDNYAAAAATTTLTIEKVAATVTAASGSKVYGTPDPDLTPTSEGFLPFDNIVVAAAGREGGNAVGSYATYATASGEALSNYEVVTIDGSLSVTPATLVVTADDATREYNTPNPVFTGTLVSVVGGDAITATYTTSATTVSPAGTYDIVPALVGPADLLANYDVTYVRGTLTVTPPPNTPPVCSAVTPSTRTIWPANGRWIAVSLSGATDFEGGALQYRIASIFQDEPTDSTGDRNTAIDGRGVGTSTAEVRAERQGNGNGRVYHITFVVTDEGGLSCTGTVTVDVPHNQKASAVDDGPRFDSTVATGGRGRR